MPRMNREQRSHTDGRMSVYYARSPVPTATGITFKKGIFDSLFAGTA